MAAVVDSSILIDFLRNEPPAVELLIRHRRLGILHSNIIIKAEVLIGMRSGEEALTSRLLETIEWHALDDRIVEDAGALGRRWLPSHRGIEAADFILAATANLIGLPVLTLNVSDFPMFPDLKRPY